MSRAHLIAILTALFVIVLWSSSWVLIKWGLEEIAPLGFAGLRYALAALILIPFAVTRRARTALAGLDRRGWAWLIGFGLIQYGVTQAAQFLALSILPATTLSLMLAFTPALVALLGGLALGERVGERKWWGVIAFLIGAGLYLGADLPRETQWLGLAVGAVGVTANAAQSLMGRKVNRDLGLPPSVVTAVSMVAGAAALMTTAVSIEGWHSLSGRGWLIVGWLSAVNTALAFWLWNRAQARLGALETSLINSTMLIQIAILAVIFLGERPGAIQIAGLIIAALGVLWVQLARPKPTSRREKGRSGGSAALP